jgi:membrane-associated phospholipid phosphatase
VSEFDLLTNFDSSIPFIPEFIWIYHTLIPAIFITLYFFISRERIFFSTFSALMVATIILSLFYILFPSFYPRDAFCDTSSLSGLLVELTRIVDGAGNTFPSGHVTFSWLLFLYIRISDKASKLVWVKPLYFIWAILIAVSTLVLKQHYIIDVVSGIVLAYICYFLSKNIVLPRLNLDI